MNIFLNPEEGRLRAGWRLAAQLFLMFLIGTLLLALISSFFVIPSSTLFPIAMAIGAAVSIKMAVKGLDQRRWVDFGLTFNQKSLGQYAFGFALAGIVMGILFLIEFAAGWLTFIDFGWNQLNTSSFLLLLAGYFLLMVVVGFYEELVFRGYQIVNLSEGLNQPRFRRSKAVIGGVVLSSLIFGIMHGLNPSAGLISSLYVALAGAMLAFPFIITGRLSLSIGLHIGWNFFEGGIFGFSMSGIPNRASLLQIQQRGPAFITGSGFGPEAGLIGLLGLALVITGLIYYFKYYGQPIAIHPRLGIYNPSPRKYPHK